MARMSRNWQDYLPFAMVAILLIIMVFGFSGAFKGPGVADPDKECNFPDVVCGLGQAIGIPDGWMRTDTFIWYMIIPVAGIWMIIYGFLDRIRIFKSSISAVLAFLIAFSMIPLGIFVLIVSIIFSIMGIYSVILFFILFIVGTLLYARGAFRSWKDIYGSYDKAIAECDKPIEEAETQINHYTRQIDLANRKKGKYKNLTGAAYNRQVNELIRTKNYWIKRREEWVVKKKTLEDDKRRQRKMFMAEEKA